MPELQNFDNNENKNIKIFGRTDKNFNTTNPNPHNEEGKPISLSKLRHEVFQSKMLNEDQDNKLKKIIFFLEELYPKITNNNIAIQQGTSVFQLLNQVEYTVFALLNSLKSTFEEQMKEIVSVEVRLEEMQNNLKNFESNYKSKHEFELEKLEKTRKEIQKSLKDKEISENSHFFTIQKLTSENEYLQEKLKSLLNFQDFKKLMQELEAARVHNRLKTEQYETELREREVILTRYEIMYSGTKRMNEELDVLNKNLEKKILELQNELSAQKMAYEKLEEDRNMYRERAFMQRADQEELQSQHEHLHEYLEKMKDRYLFERKRGELLAQQNSSDRLEELNFFGYEVKAFEYIRSLLYSSPGKHSFSKQNEDHDTEKGKEKVKENLIQEIDLKNYMIAKPTYLSLFQKQKLYSKMKEVKFSHDFIATLRGIFDSKYNEFLYADSYTQISRFPDFVYSWIGKFVIDSTTRKVRTADIKDPDPEIVRNEMIILFQNPMAARLWDCIIFKEFLDELHTRDELIYFLQCRNILFRGPQLNDQSATFTFSYYVKLEWAEHVLEKILQHKHRRETINLMKLKFRERSKLKKDVLLVDSGFLLRVLLEEYKKEKTEKLIKLKKALSEDLEAEISHHNGKLTLYFDNFKDFLGNHFPEVYDLEKAELYRKCWIFGNGNIDPDTILMILNEENFFTRTMKFPHLDDKFIPKSPGTNFQNTLEKIYDSVRKQYENIESDVDFVQEIAAKLGVEKFLGDLYEFEKNLKSQSLLEGKGFQNKDIHLSLVSFSSHMYKLSQIMLNHDDLGKEINVYNDLGNVFGNIKQTLKGLLLLQGTEVREFEMNIKAKKLQKFFKSKLSTWYKLMNYILKNKLKNYGSKKAN